MNKNKTLLIIFIVGLAYFIQHLMSVHLGMSYEESRDANAFLLATEGQLPYRDFEWMYGPFSFLLYPFIVKVFGVSLIVLRISYIIFASFVIPLAYFLARRIMPPLWAGVASFLSIVFFDVPYYTYNHVFAVIGGLACLLMICRFIEDDRKGLSSLFWAGIFASITFLTKPLLSGVTLIGTICLYLLILNGLGPLRKRLKYLLIFILSSSSLIFIYSIYFYSQTALKNLPLLHPYFAQDSLFFTTQLHRIDSSAFLLLCRKFLDIFPVHYIAKMSSFAHLKKVFVNSLDNFVFCLRLIAPLTILFVYGFS